MKKSTIWAIAAGMGLCFLVLLYLEAGYLEDIVNMRRQQFDQSVNRSLFMVARGVEVDETRQALEESLNSDSLAKADEYLRLLTDTLNDTLPELNHRGVNDGVRTLANSHRSGENKQALRTREELKRMYRGRKDLLNTVVYNILYQNNDKPLVERINFSQLDRHLTTALQNNGIDLEFHYNVTLSDGREIFRCSDYVEPTTTVYHRKLFPNDNPAQSGEINVHFPDMHKYIFASVRFVVPAIIFTFILLVTFCFTVYTIFRQKRLNEIKNDFINNMTHEFKTPISTISLAAQMLSDPSVTKSESMMKHVSGIINDETKRLRFQVEKILQMSMFERNGDAYKRVELEMNSVIGDVVNTFRLKVESTGGKIIPKLDADDTIVFGDQMHLTNVIFNLLDNAVKYKSPERDLELQVATHNSSGRLVIEISDNGIGIKRENLKKIFEKFYRVHTGKRHDVKGFGLGLAYVKNVVDFHKGTIHADSELGKGTRFIISLPLIGNE